MNVSIPKDLEARIQARLAGGGYQSVSEVVREALRLFFDHDDIRQARLDRVRREIEEGVQQARDGDVVDGQEVMRQLRALLDDRTPRTE